jgi:hypothetical protein
MGEMRNAYINLVGKPEGKKLFRRCGADGRILLKCSLKHYNGRIRPAQVKNQWQSSVNVVINFEFYKRRGIS